MSTHYERNKEKYAANQRAFHAANPGYSTRLNNRRREELQAQVYEHYGSYCSCCKEDNLLFLSIDHVNNDGFSDLTDKGYRVSGSALYRKIIKLDFPDSYQVLCMNCNFGKMRNKGMCPHSCNVVKSVV